MGIAIEYYTNTGTHLWNAAGMSASSSLITDIHQYFTALFATVFSINNSTTFLKYGFTLQDLTSRQIIKKSSVQLFQDGK
ncbi:hypothetical protein ABGT15_09525 [Flavobacterium enshiense]